MRNYEGLTRYLLGQQGDVVVLTLMEIESYVGTKLPDSARSRNQYWENATKPEHRTPANRAARLGGYSSFLLRRQRKVRFVRDV